MRLFTSVLFGMARVRLIAPAGTPLDQDAIEQALGTSGVQRVYPAGPIQYTAYPDKPDRAQLNNIRKTDSNLDRIKQLPTVENAYFLR